MEILGVWGDEVDIMMGFDVLPGDAHLAKEEDFDFFTGYFPILPKDPTNMLQPDEKLFGSNLKTWISDIFSTTIPNMWTR